MKKSKKNPFNSKFTRGSGCYRCNCCKRLTRDTGQGEAMSHVCSQCWEIGGWDNGFTDHRVGETVQEVVKSARYCLELIEQCERLGGNPAANSGIKALMMSIVSSEEVAKSYLPSVR